ncbi:MAG: hypothetical protein Q9177_006514, partial [Variospora cf. flavescens]
KLRGKPSIRFPRKLCGAIAGITDAFSFAYLQEAFVATLLTIAGNRSAESTRGGDGDDEGGDLDDYELWREMKKQVKALRNDMHNSQKVTAVVEIPEERICYDAAAQQDSAPTTKATSTSALTIGGKETTVRGEDMGHSSSGPVIFDRDGEASTAMIKHGAGNDGPLFASDGSIVDMARLALK